ncbi:putative Late nodulin [Lupinus albus]|uniref:Putative Late nodulin n=1 Tax=Lupinus albus TaxID=3870 RepID=A0A6A4PCI7_LUPAL|nr:putative Late nodulin [Lupinus albus]
MAKPFDDFVHALVLFFLIFLIYSNDAQVYPCKSSRDCDDYCVSNGLPVFWCLRNGCLCF